MVSLGELLLPEGTVPYTTTTLTRLILQPGETITPGTDVPVMYYVELGSLAYELQPYIGVMDSATCVPEDGPLSVGGSITLSADGRLTVTQGQSVTAEHGISGSLVNTGTTPLVLLQVSVIAPHIDPVSGLPIVDPATAGNKREHV